MGIIHQPLRITYKVPWCPHCKKHVDDFKMERDEDKGTITFIAKCHGREHFKTIDERGLQQEEASKFFNDARMFTSFGRDISHKIPKGPKGEPQKAWEAIQRLRVSR